MEVTATRSVECLLAEEQEWDDSVELIASELRLPLDLIKVSAEGLAQELRETHGDPTDIDAAEELIHSAEKMRRIVQALIQASRALDFQGEA